MPLWTCGGVYATLGWPVSHYICHKKKEPSKEEIGGGREEGGGACFVGHAVGLSAAPGDTPALKSGSNSSFQGGSAKAMARDKKLVEDTTASASDSDRRVTRWSNEDKQAQMIGKETKKNLIKNASPVKTRQKANCTKNVFLKPIIAKKEQQAPYMYAALKHKKHKSHKSLHEAPCTSLPQNQKSFFPIWFT